MKKTLSVVLAVIMVLCCFPFAAFADGNVVYDTSAQFTSSNQLESNTTYTIKSGTTMTVPSDLTLYIPTGATIIVEEGAKLVVNGYITMLDGGYLYVYGKLVGGGHIGGPGEAYCEYRFPSLASQGLTKTDGTSRVEISYAVSENGNAYEDLADSLKFTAIPDNGGNVMVALNQYIYIKAHIIEPDESVDKFDDSLLNVYAEGVGVNYLQGSHIMQVASSADVTYGTWTTDNDFLSTFKIYLPTGTGYTVYGRNGEQSAFTDKTVTLKYGQSFSFKVEIEDEYDMSQYEVYIYNGYGWTGYDTTELLKDIAPAEPDEYGYYNIDCVKGDTTIYVIGVVKNETITLIGDILSMIRSIFETIKEFFSQLFGSIGNIGK